METMDQLYRYCSEINENFEISEYNDQVILVKNLYKNPERMVKFQSLLSKWESCSNAKPGIMSLKLPYWTGTDIAVDVLNLEDKFDDFLTDVEFYYFYYNNTGLDSEIDDLRSNNCTLPHTDPGTDRSITNLIGLVNLNKRPVKTGFWSFEGNIVEETEEICDRYNEYAVQINHQNYSKKINNGILDNIFNIEYNFNEAIFYNASCFHQPVIDKYYTRENPRIMMRFSYVLDEEQECGV